MVQLASQQQMTRIDHVGYTTTDLVAFERFWCGVLGFKKHFSSTLLPEMTKSLFDYETDGYVEVHRYCKDGIETEVEAHVFRLADGSCYASSASQNFMRDGISHCCLHTGGPGSRQRLLSDLPPDVEVRIFDNPGGWKNIFLVDYQGNMIELREDLK